MSRVPRYLWPDAHQRPWGPFDDDEVKRRAQRAAEPYLSLADVLREIQEDAVKKVDLNELSELLFHECDTCRKKPGSPILCDGCLHNREVISELHRIVRGEAKSKKCTCRVKNDERGKPHFRDFNCPLHGR